MNTKAVCALLLLAVAGAVAEEFNCAAQGRVCQNGGVCSEPPLNPQNNGNDNNLWTTPVCICKAPYGGPDCSWTIRECKDSPCQNGGTCSPATCNPSGNMNQYDCFTCTCPAGWTGAPAYSSGSNPYGICDWPQAIGDCSVNSCANGGTCTSNARSASTPSTYTCACTAGWVGGLNNNCTIPVFNCNTNSPCQNGGTCNVAGTQCSCPAGWPTGADLTCAGARFCDANTCANGGTCTNTVGGAGGQCQCTANFEGPLCTIPKFCTVNTCQNGGTCVNSGSGFGAGSCTCLPNYGGALCEIPPFCSSSPCQNGATCTNAAGGAGTCTNCPRGFAGTFCERPLVGCGADKVDCAVEHTTTPGTLNTRVCPCRDQASCATTAFETTCRCSATHYDCRCNSTFVPRCPGDTGGLPGRNVDMVCQNGGTCMESAEQTACRCRPGFWGPSCENYDNPCLNSPCQNGGRCGIISETGTFWNTKNSLDVNGAQAGGLVGWSAPLDDRFWGYQCTCRWPYYGENCELVAPRTPVVCTATSCQNGGTCNPTAYSTNGNIRKRVGNFMAIGAPFDCSCTANFTGVYCETPVTTCESYQAANNGPYCLNGGQCRNGLGTAVQPSTGTGNRGALPACMCPCGYAGDRCEIMAANVDATSLLTFSGSSGGVGYRLDFCSREPCQNGGTCQTMTNGQDFFCACKSGYGDRYCQTRVRSAAAGVVPSVVAVAAALAVAFALKH